MIHTDGCSWKQEMTPNVKTDAEMNLCTAHDHVSRITYKTQIYVGNTNKKQIEFPYNI